MSKGFTRRVKHSSFPFHCPGSLHRKDREKSRRLFTSLRRGQQDRNLGTTNGFLTHMSWADGIHQRGRSGGKQWKEGGKRLVSNPGTWGILLASLLTAAQAHSSGCWNKKAPTAIYWAPPDAPNRNKKKFLSNLITIFLMIKGAFVFPLFLDPFCEVKHGCSFAIVEDLYCNKDRIGKVSFEHCPNLCSYW
ncbi:hypothetical protein L3X38_010443 [Prunus dulcis]|uniref:Uncharacterized protein n=1 Tax=Prunus dulcis TaxID=3755 RepID=A0AAD4WGC5_PRUDU|nr:hypothetical protein L3X38_010443 [Prunus dulcis]